MTDLFNGVLVWGALYVIGVVADAEMHGNHPAALMGLLCAGVTYLCYLSQMMSVPRVFAMVSFGISVASGVASGLMLFR